MLCARVRTSFQPWRNRAALQATVPEPKAERVFKKYLHILCTLLRYLAPHPRVMDLQGAAFDFAAARRLPERRAICRSVFDIATHVARLPPGVQDSVLTGLMQLLIGFPAECNDFSAKVRSFPAPASTPQRHSAGKP